MVVVENLLYILDTEVSSVVSPQLFNTPLHEVCSKVSEVYMQYGLLCVFLRPQDTLSLWDLHFLVMIHCWPDLAINDFELTTECGSASMVAYVSTFYSILLLEICRGMCFN